MRAVSTRSFLHPFFLSFSHRSFSLQRDHIPRMKVRHLRRSTPIEWTRRKGGGESNDRWSALFRFRMLWSSSFGNLISAKQVLTDFDRLMSFVRCSFGETVTSHRLENSQGLGIRSTGNADRHRIYVPSSSKRIFNRIAIYIRFNDQFFPFLTFEDDCRSCVKKTLRQIKTSRFFPLCRVSRGYRSVTRVNTAERGDESICRGAIHSVLNANRSFPCVDTLASHLLNVSFPSARNFPRVK